MEASASGTRQSGFRLLLRDSGHLTFPVQPWWRMSFHGITRAQCFAQRSYPTDKPSHWNNQVSSVGLSLLDFKVMQGACWCQLSLPHEHAVKIRWIHIRERTGLPICGVWLGTREERLFTVGPLGERRLRGKQLFLLWLRNSIRYRHSSNKATG